MQEHAHGVHAQRFSPTEFLVDLRRIEGVGLPHLKLVYRAGGKVIAAHNPRLVLVPLVGFGLVPARSGRLRKELAAGSQ